jgi:hypothetical protein
MNGKRWFRVREATAASSAGTLERPEVQPMGEAADTKECPTCHGKGKINGTLTCPSCHGKGVVPMDWKPKADSGNPFAKEAEDLRAARMTDFFGDGSLRESAVARMSEKDYSTETRIQAAKDGNAIPIRDDSGEITGGAFPILDGGDVEDAVSSIGRAGDPAEAKAHIVKQAKKFGATDKVPDDWKGGKAKESDAGLEERIARLERETNVIARLREAKPEYAPDVYSTPTRVRTSDGQEGYKIVLIREGKGNADDDRWYTGDAIREMCESGRAEGMQAFANHPDLEEEQNRPERDVRQLVGYYRDVTFRESGGSKRAEAVFVPLTLDENHPTYGWVVTLAEAAVRANGPQPLCGISLYGFAAGDYGRRPDMSEGSIATMIVPSSADIVTNAGAGGGFVRQLLKESARLRGINNRKEQPMTAAQFKQKLAEATTRLREADSDEARTSALAEITALQGQEIDAPPKPVDSLEALTEAAPRLVEQIREAAKKEGGEDAEALKTQLAEAQKALGQYSDVVALSGALREAGVTDEVELRKFASDARKLGYTEAADIKEMVEVERKYQEQQRKALTDAIREAAESAEVEGVWTRLPEGEGNGGAADSTDLLRESGIPIKKQPAAA